MKTYLLTLCLFFYYCFNALAQKEDAQYKITKEYNNKGELIRYDSISLTKNKWVASNYSFGYDKEQLDSLLNSLDHIGTKMGIFLPNSICCKIDQTLKDKNFHLWMDDFEGNGTSFKLEDLAMKMDSVMACAHRKANHFNAINDTLIEQHLEKELKRIQKKLKKIKAKKAAQ